MGERPHEREWQELDNIDYFLEQLARAVERGEVHRSSYDLLAPRYLQRREDLVAVITDRLAGPPASSATPAPAAAPVAPARVPVVTPRVAPVRSAPKPVPWTTVLTFTGAFLVIVASAIFAVATWDLFGVGFKLAFLGVLTAGFYGAAHLVRTRLKLVGGSVALTVVGSAMLLFDGWIAIDGFGWSGVWPWVAWLAVCSGVYWYTETAFGGGFFGLTGAAAQVAWVWLLADGFGWSVPVRAAAVAVIACAWAVAARRARGRSPFASLASLLAVAAPLTVLLAAFVLFAAMIDMSPGWPEIVAALVAAMAASATVQLSRLPAGLGAACHVPVFVAFATSGGAVDLVYAGVLFAMALLYASYELYRGGWGHGILALVAELGGWLAIAVRFDWAADVTLAVVIAVACSWSLAAYLLAVRAHDVAPLRGSVPLRRVAFAGGWVVLAACTLLMPAAREVVPLTGITIVGRDVALALYVFAAWAALAVLHRAPLAVLVAFPASLYAAASLMAWLFPGWHSALYAVGLLVTAAAWLFGRREVEMRTGLPAAILAWLARITTVPVLIGGLAVAAIYFESISWEGALLFAAMAVWWFLDALLAEEPPLGLAVAAGMSVFAVAVAVGTFAEPIRLIGWPGAAMGLALAVAGLVLRSRGGWGGPWAYGAAAAGTVTALFSLGEPAGLTVALSLAAATWVCAAVSSRLTATSLAGGTLAIGALFALSAWIDRGPWVTFALVAVPSFGALVPAAIRCKASDGRFSAWCDMGLVTGLIGLFSLVFVPVAAHDLVHLPPEWLHLGGHGLAGALLALGAYAMIASALKGLEPGAYLGVALVLAAYLVERATLDVGTAEWVSTPIALYIAWIGYRWARLRGVRVPLMIDVATVLVGLGAPAMLAADPHPGADPWTHLVWAVGLSLVAIALGVGLRVRGYFFGGVIAIVFTALVRSWVYLVSFWWLVLGLIGVTMLVVALTWEHQRGLYATTRSRMGEALSDWR